MSKESRNKFPVNRRGEYVNQEWAEGYFLGFSYTPSLAILAGVMAHSQDN